MDMMDKLQMEKLRKDIYTAKLTAYTTRVRNLISEEKLDKLRKQMDEVQRMVDEICDEIWDKTIYSRKQELSITTYFVLHAGMVIQKAK